MVVVEVAATLITELDTAEVLAVGGFGSQFSSLFSSFSLSSDFGASGDVGLVQGHVNLA